MSRDLKKGEKQEKGSYMAEKVVVAVKASKEIPKIALVWALTHGRGGGGPVVAVVEHEILVRKIPILLVITLVSHTRGPRFEPGLRHNDSLIFFSITGFAELNS
ncbi:unnamed protein product [Fraxinus pennsylvanica]|uniref:Uncharacterized protein n=1 Tax=Fraxinus pennsylvanica TaxID=56036 RepID=A0AAD2E8V4_9LAMI|nr:unnamed protein product [Fraxinus pennsylvanica]